MAKKRAARKSRGRGKGAVAAKMAAKGAAKTRAKGAAKKRAKGAAKKRAAKSAAKRSKPAKGGGRRVAKRAAGKGGGRKRAAKSAAAKPAAGGEELLTLTEVSKRTGISMPTLQRYKREYQNRLQTVGSGRTQRFKAASLEVFKQIKEENLKKRGRPRRADAGKAKAAKKRAARPAKGAPEGLISLSEIGRRTGISYPTLLRYVRLHGDRIPSHGSGRRRRFPVEAVPVFSQLRKESRRGRRKGSGPKKAAAGGSVEARLKRLEKSNAALEKQVKRLLKALRRPVLR